MQIRFSAKNSLSTSWKRDYHNRARLKRFTRQFSGQAKGADVVKQWDATLDGRTRDSHRRVDGEIRELDEKFSNGLMFPGDPSGGAAEVVNCRCTSNTRARWALGEEELQTLKDRAEYFGLDKTKNFEEYKQKYLKASEESESQWGIVYGNTDVDFKHINSREYKDKFSALTGIPEVNESLYDTSKAILKHCDGTEHEDKSAVFNFKKNNDTFFLLRPFLSDHMRYHEMRRYGFGDKCH